MRYSSPASGASGTAESGQPDRAGPGPESAFPGRAGGGGARAGVRQDARAPGGPLAGEPGQQLRVGRAHVPAPVVGHQLVGARVVEPQPGRPDRTQLGLGQLADRRGARQLDPLECVRRQTVAGQERRREHALVDDLEHGADVEHDRADHRSAPVSGPPTDPVRARTCICTAVNLASSTVVPVWRRARTAAPTRPSGTGITGVSPAGGTRSAARSGRAPRIPRATTLPPTTTGPSSSGTRTAATRSARAREAATTMDRATGSSGTANASGASSARATGRRTMADRTILPLAAAQPALVLGS